jgi:predicted dehydrogenase
MAELVRTITLVGSGEVGSRHLQALLRLEGPLRIQVVESSARAKEVALARAAEVGVPSDVTIEWRPSLEGLTPASLTIVATLATGRAALIARLLGIGDRRFLVEKIVCQSSEEFSELQEKVSKYAAKAWVNCPRRYYPFYEQLRRDLAGIAPVTMKVSAGNRGLGCNAIHYLDVFEYLTGRQPTSLVGALLLNRVDSNRRRANLVEFSGTLAGVTPADDVLDITFAPVGLRSALVTLTSPVADAFADEMLDFAARGPTSRDQSWSPSEFGHRNVSDVTTQVAREILDTDDCRFATLERSAALHSLLFDVFNNHLERVTGTRPSLCPIT